MNDETQEQIEKVVVAAPVPGFFGQAVKGVKIVLETKKLAMAAYAVLFGVSVGTANMTAQTTAEETVKENVQVVELQTTITKLESKIILLEQQQEQDRTNLIA